MPGVFDLSSDESAGETGTVPKADLPAARPKRRPRTRRSRNEYKAWTCKPVLNWDLFAMESLESETRSKAKGSHSKSKRVIAQFHSRKYRRSRVSIQQYMLFTTRYWNLFHFSEIVTRI